MEIKLLDREMTEFQRYLRELEGVTMQLNLLIEKRQLVMRLLSAIYEKACMRKEFEDKKKYSFPPLFDPAGTKMNATVTDSTLIVEGVRDEGNKQAS